ncbi:MAG: bifunctional phosphopantothenoylcysteine decarboxylase/phosphopantothenate--cysteine ligase CoaBC [Firmicutes bacterium]|nr:bifunctional phosphopantothenoylcysteine decarboxylase/phosphopantothenate--cysteine ligase CoaBC [Bacillota bacterium]
MAPTDRRRMVLGISGGIAAYKACELIRLATKAGFEVRVIMTRAATEFITPLTLRTLSNNKVVTDMFEEPERFEIEHVSLAQWADVFVVAPATANVIGKMASGIADDMLTSTVLACKSPKVIAPAMNTAMWENPITQRNIETLRDFGFIVLRTDKGQLACGDIGYGRMIPPERILQHAIRAVRRSDRWSDLRCLVTAGPTREPLDPVRFIGNRSSGKMGYAMAVELWQRGAEVTLVSGPVCLDPPEGIEVVPVSTTREMLEACAARFSSVDVAVFSAAPGDFAPADPSDSKIKKRPDAGRLVVELEQNPDIAAALGEVKRKGQITVGFAAETERLVENASSKLAAKNLDMIVANDVTAEGAGFEVDTNIASIVYRSGQVEMLDRMAKSQLAAVIADRIESLL